MFISGIHSDQAKTRYSFKKIGCLLLESCQPNSKGNTVGRKLSKCFFKYIPGALKGENGKNEKIINKL